MLSLSLFRIYEQEFLFQRMMQRRELSSSFLLMLLCFMNISNGLAFLARMALFSNLLGIHFIG